MCRYCGLPIDKAVHLGPADCAAAVVAEEQRRRAALTMDLQEWADEDPPRDSDATHDAR